MRVNPITAVLFHKGRGCRSLKLSRVRERFSPSEQGRGEGKPRNEKTLVFNPNPIICLLVYQVADNLRGGDASPLQ